MRHTARIFFNDENNHICRHRSTKSVPCADYHPLQKCELICGICIMVVGALAAYEYPLFEQLIESNIGISKVSYLENFSSESDLM